MGDILHRSTPMITAQSMIRFLMNFTTKLKRFLEMFLILLHLVSSAVVAAIEICLLTLYPGNHEANCDNGANLAICVPGQLNFTGYIAHWKYVNTIPNFNSHALIDKIKVYIGY